MRIVIDLQGAQSTGSRDRGIGRYSMSLAQAMVRNRGEHEILIALSDLFPDTIEPIRAAFHGLLPQVNIHVWSATSPVSSIDITNDWRRETAELVREAFLASLKPDIVHVSSFFEGHGDDAVTSVGKFLRTTPTAVTLYDLIPYIYPKPYLENPSVEAWYLRKLKNLREADLLLAISESSRGEGIELLGFPDERAINISTDADTHFKPQKISSESEHALREKYGLHRPFLMYTGGIDHRKNIEGLIRAFCKLPSELRKCHQLVIVCSVQRERMYVLEQLAAQHGSLKGDVVLTGFVPEDDLLALYNLCSLFIFPSWHEGFGLPALEAMRCGAPVIGANISSLPEVIGWDEAMFDPHSDEAMASAMERALSDDIFRRALVNNGKKQSSRFSWDESARRALAAMEQLHAERTSTSIVKDLSVRRPRLAYVSPLPDEKSGIADYSAELLPELARFYKIDVIVAQDVISDPWIRANCAARSVQWFVENSDKYERVLYQFGNSAFHQHMFSLLNEIPGVVVLHEFFLSHVLEYMEGSEYQKDAWSKALYDSHGYKAVRQRFYPSEAAEVNWSYPCNLEVIQNALGLIVHSEHPRQLANQFFGHGAAEDWGVIPLLRVAKNTINKADARRQLKLNNNDFVVCSFGLLGPAKLNHRLLNAWLGSTLAKNTNCVLIFVGGNSEDKYGADLLKRIGQSGIENRIRITGWIDPDIFNNYLAAADVGVQLRENSRGETSAAVLDCMNYGLATIVNAHGSMADLADDAVCKIADQFSDLELTATLESLFHNQSQCYQLGLNAQQTIHSLHAPRACGDQYVQAVETMYCSAKTGVNSLIGAVASLNAVPSEHNALINLAESIAQSIPNTLAMHQLFVDISELVVNDHKTGVQRVVRSILLELLNNPPVGYRVEPVYGDSSGQGYRYARKFTLQMLDCPNSFLNDDIIEFNNGDIFLGLDFYHSVTLAHDWFYQKMRNYGVQVHFVVYDLLPVQFPHFWDPIHRIDEIHHNWLSVLSKTDGVI
ncbi:MAG: glycosyltransferase, partial [Pseudomonadota bacterium]